MTEAEWLSSTDALLMLDSLGNQASARKRRLLMCAAARQFCPLAMIECVTETIEVAEGFADSVVSALALRQAYDVAWERHLECVEEFLQTLRAARGKYRRHVKQAQGRADASGLAALAVREEPFLFRGWITDGDDPLGFYALELVVADVLQQEGDLTRELFGNPFQPPARPIPGELGWNNGVIQRLAIAAYEERSLPSGHLDAERLTVLADALEEAGADTALLDHLRQPGQCHVRGCWAVDLVLGKS